MSKTFTKVIDEQDLDMNPELADAGIQVGDEVEIEGECTENGDPLDQSDAE